LPEDAQKTLLSNASPLWPKLFSAPPRLRVKIFLCLSFSLRPSVSAREIPNP
jgi:hypothetical protein